MFKVITLAAILTAAALAQLGGGLIWPGPGLTSVAPVQPPAGMQFWFSADCITFTSSVCGVPSNGSVLATWADRSGNANNGTLSTGVCTFNTNQINSQPAVTFANCHLDLVSNVINWQTTGGTAFIVVDLTSTVTRSTYFSGPINSIAWISGSGATEQSADQTGNKTLGNGTAAIDTSWHQMNISIAGGTGVQPVFRIARAVDTLTAGSNTVAPRNQNQTSIGYHNCCGIENTVSLVGKLAEFISYGSVLSGPNVTQVETYLHNKYGL